jgi:hypothetical protein
VRGLEENMPCIEYRKTKAPTEMSRRERRARRDAARWNVAIPEISAGDQHNVPAACVGAPKANIILSSSKVRIVRDYGRFDRREAPQFYPDVKGVETKHPEPAH